jgi:hypothetical protein
MASEQTERLHKWGWGFLFIVRSCLARLTKLSCETLTGIGVEGPGMDEI